HNNQIQVLTHEDISHVPLIPQITNPLLSSKHFFSGTPIWKTSRAPLSFSHTLARRSLARNQRRSVKIQIELRSTMISGDGLLSQEWCIFNMGPTKGKRRR